MCDQESLSWAVQINISIAVESSIDLEDSPV